ncbi:MAG: hypothetical protein IKK77_01820 [Clostridia bacterium]|nr:hypothetical protein [Clostridia bacterium]
MENIWDISAWGSVNLVAVLLLSLLFANLLKRKIKILSKTLIPTSVLGGLILLIISIIYKTIFGTQLFNENIFGGNGISTLEMITYHSLAIGFIATSFKPSKEKFNKKRTVEVLNTGITTVATYLIQGIVGLAITLFISSFIFKDFFAAAGIILPFGYGQGTGQAMNYGNIYETDYGFIGGKSFGLTIAAFGFLSASIGGVFYLHMMKKKGKYKEVSEEKAEVYEANDVQGSDEIPMNGSVDKITVQMGFVLSTYLVAYLIMYFLGNLLPGLKSILYGFNFLFGVLIAVAVNSALKILKRKGVMKRQYVNNFLMNRISGFFFDIMIVAGIGAIQIDVLKGYWTVLLILGIAGLATTYLYVKFVSRRIFPEYEDEQFLSMYGMLTGTASTGIILLREVDKRLEGNAAENLVYQNVPAIVFGFPMMIVATIAPQMPLITLGIIVLYFLALNIFLFRSKIFKRKNMAKGKSNEN